MVTTLKCRMSVENSGETEGRTFDGVDRFYKKFGELCSTGLLLS